MPPVATVIPGIVTMAAFALTALEGGTCLAPSAITGGTTIGATTIDPQSIQRRGANRARGNPDISAARCGSTLQRVRLPWRSWLPGAKRPLCRLVGHRPGLWQSSDNEMHGRGAERRRGGSG